MNRTDLRQDPERTAPRRTPQDPAAQPRQTGTPRSQTGTPRPQTGAPRPQQGTPRTRTGTPRTQTGTPRPQTGTRQQPSADQRIPRQQTVNGQPYRAETQARQDPSVRNPQMRQNPAPSAQNAAKRASAGTVPPSAKTKPAAKKGFFSKKEAPSAAVKPSSDAAAVPNGAAAAAAAEKKKAAEKENIETVIRLRGGVDRPFLVLVIILVCIGSAMVFSASYAYADYHFGDSLYFVRSQLRWVAVGFTVMFIVMNIDYRVYQKLTMPAFLVTLVFMGLVAIPGIGVVKNGARRWLEIAGFSFQPSELMKLALIMVLALYVSANRGQMNDFRHGILFPYCIIGLVCFVTALEKHLSATMILLMIGTIVIFIGGAPIRWLGGFAGAGAALVALGIAAFKYARQRVAYWIHPESDPGAAGYQLLQSLYAIGSGGFLGTGLGNSRQKYLSLPESQNDFIYAVVCEEFGFVGAITVIVLFALLVWRGVVIATSAPDTYSSLIVLGITAQVALQCIMNMAVVTGTMPVTGVSLPFFSYGGTSLVMLMFQMGMILSVSRYSYQQKS